MRYVGVTNLELGARPGVRLEWRYPNAILSSKKGLLSLGFVRGNSISVYRCCCRRCRCRPFRGVNELIQSIGINGNPT